MNEMLQAFQDILKQSKGVKSQTEEALAGVVGRIERAKLRAEILPQQLDGLLENAWTALNSHHVMGSVQSLCCKY